MQTPLASINATLELLDKQGVTAGDWNRLRTLPTSKLRQITNMIRFGMTGYFPAYAQVVQLSDCDPLKALENDPRFSSSKAFRDAFLGHCFSGKESKIRVGKVTPRDLGLLKPDGSDPLVTFEKMCERLRQLGHGPLRCEDAAVLIRNESPEFFMWLDIDLDRYDIGVYEKLVDGARHLDYTYDPRNFSARPDDSLCFELGW
jgi:hypothetical protein